MGEVWGGSIEAVDLPQKLVGGPIDSLLGSEPGERVLQGLSGWNQMLQVIVEPCANHAAATPRPRTRRGTTLHRT